MRDTGSRGDLDLAVASAAGLVLSAVAIGGLLARAAGLAYRPLAHDVEPLRDAMSTSAALAALTIGCAVWMWHWLLHYRNADRTTLWYGLVILIGGLGGLSTAIVAVTIGAYRSLVWAFNNDAVGSDWSHYFTFVPAVAAAAITGGGSWWYHWFVLGRRDRKTRSEPMRAFDYISAAAGLVAGAIGVVHVVMAAVESVTNPSTAAQPDSANRWIAAACLLAVGLPVWLGFWRRIQGFVGRSDAGERQSPVRRVYLVSLFGAGAGAAIVGLIVTVTRVVRDVLDGEAGEGTFRGVRVGLGLLVAVSGVTWYHLRIFRTEQAEHRSTQRRHREVVLVSNDGADLARHLADTCHAHVVRWHRTDAIAESTVDPALVASAIESSTADHVLVVVGSGDIQIVPFNETLAPDSR